MERKSEEYANNFRRAVFVYTAAREAAIAAEAPVIPARPNQGVDSGIGGVRAAASERAVPTGRESAAASEPGSRAARASCRARERARRHAVAHRLARCGLG